MAQYNHGNTPNKQGIPPNIQGSMPYNQPMGMPTGCCPMQIMPKLENLYPQIFYVIYPIVNLKCNEMEMKYGPLHIPNQQHLDSIINEIYSGVEPEIAKTLQQQSKDERERNIGTGASRILKDLIGILIIRELTSRRRFPMGYPGYNYGGLGNHGGFGGFPSY